MNSNNDQNYKNIEQNYLKKINLENPEKKLGINLTMMIIITFSIFISPVNVTLKYLVSTVLFAFTFFYYVKLKKAIVLFQKNGSIFPYVMVSKLYILFITFWFSSWVLFVATYNNANKALIIILVGYLIYFLALFTTYFLITKTDSIKRETYSSFSIKTFSFLVFSISIVIIGRLVSDDLLLILVYLGSVYGTYGFAKEAALTEEFLDYYESKIHIVRNSNNVDF